MEGPQVLHQHCSISVLFHVILTLRLAAAARPQPVRGGCQAPACDGGGRRSNAALVAQRGRGAGRQNTVKRQLPL